jgi:hypothetical protein
MLFPLTITSIHINMKILSFRLIASASLATIALWVGQRRRQWDSTVASLRSSLLIELPHDPLQETELWEDLPKPVQRYLVRIVSQQEVPTSFSTQPQAYSKIRPMRSLEFKQEGFILMNDIWLPFTARQLVSTRSTQPGFVWEASVSSGPLGSWGRVLLPKIQVVDAWTLGQGHLKAALFGVVPVVSAPKREHEELLLAGEMLRWLAESAWVPTILMPNQGVVHWKPISDDKALMEMTDPLTGKTVDVTAFFDKDGWLTKVECLRHRAVGNDFVLTPWVAFFYKYNFVPDVGMWIPVHAECGWIVDGKQELYFKSDNFDLQYHLDQSNMLNGISLATAS